MSITGMSVSSSSMFLVNGVQTDHISAANRGLAYGDGLFETVLMDAQGRSPLWQLHQQRLTGSLKRLKIPVSEGWLPRLELQVAELVRCYFQSHSASACLLKIIITRAAGGRGYQVASGQKAPSEVIQLMPLPAFPKAINLCEVPIRLSRNPALGGMKHLNKLEYVLAAEAAQTNGEPLLLDTDGWVIESLSKNLLLEINGQIVTPPLEYAGVAGVQRAALLKVFGDQIAEKPLRLQDFLSASAVVATNALVGVIPVHSYCCLKGNGLAHFSESESLCSRVRQRLSSVDVSAWQKCWLNF